MKKNASKSSKERAGWAQGDRRAHRRLPVVHDLLEPVDLKFSTEERGKAVVQPAILTNLSAGGMSLMTFVEPPHTRQFLLRLSLPGFDNVPVEGRILRVASRGAVFTLGIAFTKIASKDQKAINTMAEDYSDCDIRIAFKLPEACVKECRANALCSKSQKAPFWPKKSKRSSR